MTKFLQLGPCRLIPNGLFTAGFTILLISMTFCFVAKGWILAYTIAMAEPNGRNHLLLILLWVAFNILPQFLYVSFKY